MSVIMTYELSRHISYYDHLGFRPTNKSSAFAVGMLRDIELLASTTFVRHIIHYDISAITTYQSMTNMPVASKCCLVQHSFDILVITTYQLFDVLVND